MSREIKFRAWVEWTEKPRFEYSENNYPDTFWNDYCDGENVEQYTGLKDKNGKEIYEGDIVKARWRRAKHAKLDTKGKVRFDDGWFYIYDDPDGRDRLGVPVHNCYNIEVVGNIHENAELLGGEE